MSETSWLFVAFMVVWGVLLRLQLHTLRPLRGQTPKFPTPPT